MHAPAPGGESAGLPVEFESYEVEGERRSGIPRNGELFVVTSPSGGGPSSPDAS
ncbi:MAG: hypothetical protein ACRDSG_16140 [Pseudonocardiaceae bacterium]